MLPTYRSDHRHPSKSLMFLVFIALLLYMIFIFIALGLGHLIFGAGTSDFSTRNMQPDLMKLLQGVITTGAFIMPPLVLRFYERRYPAPYFFHSRRMSLPLIVLTIAIFFTASPCIALTEYFNQNLHLGDFFAGLEKWIRDKDNEMRVLTLRLLEVHSVGGLLINLLVIALLPAIGEELFFRGGLQTILTRWTKNYHLGIWIAAVIFSTIHFQFLGFVPRMLLGAMLGYLFAWSGNIFFPMLGHFINNGTAVVAAYYFQMKGKSLDEFEQAQSSNFAVTIISLVVTGFLLYRFYTYTSLSLNHKNHEENE